jgi:hypothetical protein
VVVALAVGVFPGGDVLAGAGVEMRGTDVGALTQAQSTKLVMLIAQQIQETRLIVFSRRRFKTAMRSMPVSSIPEKAPPVIR